MKRDLDLIRRILLDIEDSGDDRQSPASGSRAADNGSSTDAVHYHVQLLHEAGLIVADEIVPGQWWPERMTWEGYEFLDLARDERRWTEVQATLDTAVGAAPFQLVRELLARAMRDQLTRPATRRK